MNNKLISVFYRKKREGVNSIETVFSIIEIKIWCHVNQYLPYEGASPLNLLRNIIYAYKHRSFINHITGDAHYIALGLGRNTILTVHDVQSALQIKNPLKRLYVKLFWFWLPALMVRRITVISEFTKNELSKIIPFAKNKILVVHNAFNPTIEYVKKIKDNRSVILHMGTKPNKNLERVVKALKGMDCLLIIVGKMSEKQLLLLESSTIDYENHYDVSYEEIIQCYQRCDIVSFPSVYEGFGVPILEANAAGRPIIAGDIPVLHEVANDAACFVNPYSVDSIRSGFVKVIEHDGYREELVAKGLKNIERFSPKAIAEKYNEVYKELSDE